MILTPRFFWRKSLPSFVCPIPAAPRVVFEAFFRTSSNVRYLNPDTADFTAQLRNSNAAVIAGRLETILSVSEHVSPTHAIVIFTPEPQLSDDERDQLWHSYSVPVFEQVLDKGGNLLAWECEAHDGLHLANGAALPPGFRVDTSVCACQAATRRIVSAPAVNAPGRLVPTPIASRARLIPT